MPLQQDPAVRAASSEQAGSASRPERGMVLARGTWIILVVLTLVICFASLPVYVALLQTPCAGSACVWLQPTPGQAGALSGMGLSLAVYAAIIVALTLATLVVCLVVSALII